MPWSSEWVVLIESRPTKKKPEALGTGTLVAPGRVLTAWHVVFDEKGKLVPELFVHREGSEERVLATVEWSGSAELDVAVLVTTMGGAGTSHPLTLLSARDLGGGSEWEAQGYPDVREDHPSSELEKVRGKTCSFEKAERCLCLDVDVDPDEFGGLSGASVVVDGQIVGIVQAVAEGWDGKRLHATPVAAFLHDPGFRKALGLTSEDARLAKEVAALKANIEECLRSSSSLTAILAGKLDLPDGTGDLSSRLAEALVHTSGKVVATVLSDLDVPLDKDRELVRALLWQILPLAVEWRGLLLQARAALAGGVNAVELPLRLETVAEIVLAGVDGRCCQFAPGAPIPEGVANVPLPSVAHAPFFQATGELLVHAVVMNLGKEGEPGEKTWGPYVKKFTQYAELKTIVERKLKRSAREGARDRLPHYLLIIDAVLDPEQKRDIETSWAVARTAFGNELPSLRLVRLKGRSQEVVGEDFDVADPIRELRDRP